jgi:hypothetical protein
MLRNNDTVPCILKPRGKTRTGFEVFWCHYTRRCDFQPPSSRATISTHDHVISNQSPIYSCKATESFWVH